MFRVGLIFFVLVSSLSAELSGYLTVDEIGQFFEHGYVIKRGSLSAEMIARMEGGVREAIDKALRVVGTQEEEEGVVVDGSRVVHRKGAIARINGCSGLAPDLLEVVEEEKLLRTICEILGTDELEHIIAQIHPKLPGDGISFQRHQDIQFRKNFDPEWQDILGNGSYVICIMPVDPMTEENGGLWVEEAGERVWVTAEPGDLLFMHPLLWHGSGPNTSVKSRRTLLSGFCAYGANHKTYPGKDVNVHITLLGDGSFRKEPSPWAQEYTGNLLGGH